MIEQQKNNLKVVAEKKSARMLLPNMLTLIGVCIGLTSIRFALSGEFHLAIVAIMFAALIDGLDGRIARMIKGTSKVGKELDSLTDMISFGVAPAFIMYFWMLNTLGKFGWLLSLIYVICVALRLARFNISSNQEPSWRDNFFEGVPSPARENGAGVDRGRGWGRAIGRDGDLDPTRIAGKRELCPSRYLSRRRYEGDDSEEWASGGDGDDPARGDGDGRGVDRRRVAIRGRDDERYGALLGTHGVQGDEGAHGGGVGGRD